MTTLKQLTREEEKAVREEVIKELKRYKALIIQMKNKKESEENGVNDLFTVISDNSVENRIRVNQINRAFEGLDTTERQIIELRYLDPNNYTDIYIYDDLLKLKKKKYYLKKGEAIEQVARALGMI